MLGDSKIEVKEVEQEIEITIRIKKSDIGKKRYERIINLIKMIMEGYLGWILGPSKIEKGQEGKSWKTKPIDSLSRLVYGLVIPPRNKLKKLYETIEWGKIDKICEEAYKKGKRGAPAYAPQMMYRILVLMFISGTPFERETLRRCYPGSGSSQSAT